MEDEEAEQIIGGRLGGERENHSQDQMPVEGMQNNDQD